MVRGGEAHPPRGGTCVPPARRTAGVLEWGEYLEIMTESLTRMAAKPELSRVSQPALSFSATVGPRCMGRE